MQTQGLLRTGLEFRAHLAVVLIGLTLVSCGGLASPPSGLGSIQHIIVVVKENHNFDNYFGSLEEPKLSLPHCESFVFQSRCQYDVRDIPAYYRYVHQFAYADNYFTDVRGPSWPNDMMMIAAQSPLATDPPPPLSRWNCPTTCYDLETIGDRLSKKGVTWRNYGEELYNPFRSIRRYASDGVHNVGIPQLFDDLSTGQLPSVSWVRPSAADSEHPGFDIRRGEQWTVNVINAVMKSRYWSSTSILLTWDDAGDGNDHVAPAVIEKRPDGQAFRYGGRVALVVISPFTPAGTVSHQLLSHVSILKFIEDRYDVPPLTFRDRDANGLSGFFDLSMPPRSAVVLDVSN